MQGGDSPRVTSVLVGVLAPPVLLCHPSRALRAAVTSPVNSTLPALRLALLLLLQGRGTTLELLSVKHKYNFSEGLLQKPGKAFLSSQL